MTVNPINVPYAAFSLPEDPCPAEEKESKTTSDLPSGIEFPLKSGCRGLPGASGGRVS
jgi:hypothetical protein